jgi:outer membrane receptor protein involved in Fe transport
MLHRFKTSFLLLACVMLIASPLVAQTAATTGQIAGRVNDTDAGVLPGVTVTATNTETGRSRTVVTESNGTYLVALLPPGTYTVLAELAGLGSARRDRVQVLLGTTATVNLTLSPQIAQEITVTASAPLVDTTLPDVTTAVTEHQIENLPVLGRDFRDLALLTPGVVTTFGNRVTSGGARGMSTDYNIDGADTNSDFFGEQRGGTRAPFTFSQAAIREFQVIRSSYSAEYAKGVGATLNAITKSGTNDFSGQLFFFMRDEGWASSRPDTFQGLAISDSFDARDVDQYGFTFGGPIVRDRVHFFANADFQDFSRGVSPTDVRNTSGFQALTPADRAAFVSRVESLIGHSLDREYSFATTEDQKVYLIKLDGSLGNDHHLSVRNNYSTFENFGSEGTRQFSNQGVFENNFNTLVGELTSVFTSNLFNQFIVQWSNEERPRTPFVTSAPHTLVRVGSFNMTFGQLEFLPNDLVEDKLQIKENLTFIYGNHQFKTGFEYMKTDLDNLFPRNFAGNYEFNNVQDFLDGRVSRFRQGMGPAGLEQGNNRFDYDYWGAFIQDSWTVSNRLTLDMGLRYDRRSAPTPIGNAYPEYPEFLTNFKDDSNIAPRFGFAYDLFANGRSVVRGGAGMYYNYLPAILYADPLANIGGIYSSVDLRCSATVICPTYPNLLGRQQFDAAALSSSFIRIVSESLEAQEAFRTSLGFEQQIGTTYSVGIEGTYADLDNQQSLVNINARPTGLTYGDLIVYAVNNPNRPYPRFGDVTAHVSDAEASYRSVSVFTKKLAVGGSNLSWLAHYTWAKATDQDSNERSTSSSFRIDPFNPRLNEGPADYDVRHKVVLSGTYEAPFGILLSGIYNWRTGQPFTRGISGLGNGLFGISVATPIFRDSSGNIIDMTQASGMTPAEVSAFLAQQGATMEGRNRARHPDFSNLDLRVSRRFSVGGPLSLELIGEVFNVLNEKNQVVPGFNQNMFVASQSGGRWNFNRNANFGVANAYAFASDPRQYQLAEKLRF